MYFYCGAFNIVNDGVRYMKAKLRVGAIIANGADRQDNKLIRRQRILFQLDKKCMHSQW